MLDVSANPQQVARLKEILGGSLASKSARVAVSRTLRRLRRLVRDYVAKTLDVAPAGVMRQNGQDVLKDYVSNGVGHLKIKDVPAEAIKFRSIRPRQPYKGRNEKGKKRRPRPRESVSIRYYQGGKTITYPHAFIQKLKNGHIGMFVRKGKGTGASARKFRQWFGPSIVSMLQSRKIDVGEKFMEQARAILLEEMQGQVNRHLQLKKGEATEAQTI